MAEPYKPEEAVILFVEFGSGVYCACLIPQTYFAIKTPSELEFRKNELTRRKIPWDNFGKAVGDMLGFGNLVDRSGPGAE